MFKDEKEEHMDFKDKVVLARVRLNLSQSKLAELLNVSLATISRWETGKAIPTRKDELSFYEFCKQKNITISEDK